MLLFFVVLCICYRVVSGGILTANCTPSNGCQLLQDGLDCYGTDSCELSQVQCNDHCKVWCNGDHSCHALEGVCSNGSTCNIDIICNGFLSCMGFTKKSEGSLVNPNCTGWCSCLNQTACQGTISSDACIVYPQDDVFHNKLCRFYGEMTTSLVQPDNVLFLLPPVTQILLKANSQINDSFIASLTQLVTSYSVFDGGSTSAVFDKKRIIYDRGILFIMTNQTNIKTYLESTLEILVRDTLKRLNLLNIDVVIYYTFSGNTSQPQIIRYFLSRLRFSPGLWPMINSMTNLFPLKALHWNETVTSTGVEGYVILPSNCSFPRPYFNAICVNGVWEINDTVLVDRVDMIATRTEVFARKMEVQSEIMVFSKLNVEGLTLFDKSKLVIDGGLGVQLVVSGTLILGGSLVVRNVTFEDLIKGINIAVVGSLGNFSSENLRIYINDSTIPDERLDIIKVDSTLIVIYKTDDFKLKIAVIVLFSILLCIILFYIFSISFRKFVAPHHDREYKVFKREETF